ncbi:flavin monoamine oxidase family protein [Enteractinococcus helveticum]|uniref:Amine oxidase domain-containing protein n=1 Tax=Enteractinococcus helveticum TaxID=1837282 RepID=A0A1B7M1X9_9MICC|nr:NAD(P)/FAD-dependent oxidoreductase [Enteractinococcus helveticum]OAV62602.1 hypothetical protein A6F49_05400 [Enteractinococcus helveticum]
MSNANSNSTDVIIIGGGFAGVTAGRELSNLGLESIILEGRDRLAGRTWTKESDIGIPLEMGGTWVHWAMPYVWSEVKRYDLPLYITPFAEEAYWKTRNGLSTGTPDDLADVLDNGMNQLLSRSLEAFPTPHDPFPLTDLAHELDPKTIEEAINELDVSTEEKDVLNGIWALHFNCDAERGGFTTALRWGALANQDWKYLAEITERYKFVNGTQELLNAIQNDSKSQVKLNSPVTSIDEQEDQVVVTTRDGQRYSAKQVIVTVPINALKNLEFNGPFDPNALSIAQAGQASNGLKVWMRVQGQHKPFHCLGTSQDTLHWIQYENDLDGDSVLVAFAPDASRLDGNNVAEVQKALHEYRPDLEVLAVDSHDWVNDEFAQQTWTMFRPCQLTGDATTLLTKHTRTWLAGADYAHGWTSFIDGAIESGMRTARRISRTL